MFALCTVYCTIVGDQLSEVHHCLSASCPWPPKRHKQTLQRFRIDPVRGDIVWAPNVQNGVDDVDHR